MALTRSVAALKLSRNVPIMSRLAYYSQDGGAGAIREAGGTFGKKEAADEERYFRKMQTEQLKTLKTHLDEEITFHQQRMKEHQDAIDIHQKRITELEQKKKA
ncbi:ATPase inhibitor mai-2, mitochondrial-like [Daphnia pulicaria]|uniref:ATPase inhibitor mai-2, mitochondrial-like n=1 Tax=Daphnia pulicaria TaxID=35523 RepID=UPI001EEC41D4|nr:ATPase inhibitor mai-2, mitochondrial-like [Daphnia pulicaria]